MSLNDTGIGSALSYPLIFLTVLSLLSIYDYAQWMLSSLNPEQIISRNIQEMDGEYVDDVIQSRLQDYDPTGEGGFYVRKTPLELLDDDPLGVIVDVILAAVENDNTIVAANGIRQLEEQSLELFRELQHATDNDDTEEEYGLNEIKMLSRHFLGGFNQIYRKARSEDDQHTVYEVIKSLSNIAVETVQSQVIGAPFQVIRVFGRLSSELPGQVDSELVSDVDREFSNIQSAILEQLRDPDGDAQGLHQFVVWRRQFSSRAIDKDMFRIGSNAISSYRFIITTIVKKDGQIPPESAISMGLIGEELAESEAEGYIIVRGAKTDRSYRNFIEEAIMNIVSLRDDLREIQEERDIELNLDLLEEQIERIENRYADHVADVHDEIKEAYPEIHNEHLIPAWSFFRRTRGPFTIDQITNFFEDRGMSVDKDELIETLEILEEVGVTNYDPENDAYTANLNLWDPMAYGIDSYKYRH
jgi:hypothetical protein